MIEHTIPFLAGTCLGAAATFVVTRKLAVSGPVAYQALATLTTLYTSLDGDGKLNDTERAEIRAEVMKLIELLKTKTTVTT